MANYFKVGDPVFFGKYKNKPGKIVRFFKDGRGLPYVEVEPVPKGRKKNREIGLFNIWHHDKAKRATMAERVAALKTAEMSHAASIALMKWLSKVTQQMGVAKHVYVVGGAVRNFLIDEPIKDIDMVVDSLAMRGDRDAAWVAQQIARRIPTNTEIVTDTLMVSKVLIRGGWDLDGHQMDGNDIEIVNAREEVYEQDAEGNYLGHKPSGVKPTTLETDVTRREFTFNTLMWRLLDLAKGPEKAEIIDLTGCGLRDLDAREMRCPQDPDLTFKQDPTRILRTIKFAFKYGFKLPPDVKAAAKRQAKGLKRIPSKTWSVLQKIVMDNPQYKKALAAMADLGVTDVLAEMMQEHPSFAATMGKYSRNRGVAYMFDLMDVGIPAGAPLSFLSGTDQKRLREITSPMDREDALEYLEVLRNPGRAYKDKRFLPQLAMSKGYHGRAMAQFMPQLTDLVRALLLESPQLASNPSALKREVSALADRIPQNSKVAAKSKFKNKKQVPKADGKGTLTIYEYSKGQIQHRNREKAKRVEKLRQNIGTLRSKVNTDLKSPEDKVRLTALAVALIDQTYERVGNDKSANENGHYGITTLTIDHIKMGRGKATLSYVGKSGVEHTKTVTDKATVAALKKAMKGRGKGDRLLCDGGDCTIRAKDVNSYLRDFNITAKDLRGMHANEEVRNRLTQIRKAGPDLPRSRKDRDKILKAEFKEALAAAAEVVGHGAATLKSQYLVPGMETAYMKDGTIIDKLHKKAGKKASLEDLWGPMVCVGTKSDSEKEDEEAQRLIRNSPRKKPPRKDLERSLVQDHQDEDPDEKQDRKDRSMNWKDIAASMQRRRVITQHMAAAEAEEESGSGGGVSGAFLEFLKEEGDKKLKNPDTGNDVKLKSLKGDKGQKLQQELFQKWLSKNEDKDKGSAKPKKEDDEKSEKSELETRADAAESDRQEAEETKEEVDGIIDDVEYLNDRLSGGGVSSSDTSDFSPEQMQAFSNTFGAVSSKLDAGDGDVRSDPSKIKRLQKKVESFRELLSGSDGGSDKLKSDPKKFAEALATVDYYERVLNNPLVIPDNPLTEKGGTLSGADLEKAKESVSARAKESYGRYQGVDTQTREAIAEGLEKEIELLPEGSARRLELEGMHSGLRVLSAVEDGDDYEGGPASQQLAKAMAATGNISLLLSAGPNTMSDAISHQQELRGALGSVEDKDWLAVIGSESAGAPIAELLGDDEAGKFLTEDDRAFLREVLGDEVLGGVVVVDPGIASDAPTSGEGRALMKDRGLPDITAKAQKQVKDLLGSEETSAALSEEGSEESRKSIWDALLEILGVSRKEMASAAKGSTKDGDKPEAEDTTSSEDDRADGDVWKKDKKWYAKKDGETASFDTEQSAKDHIKPSKTSSLSRGYSFDVWGPTIRLEGHKCPPFDR
jgi:DNA topoisomerase-1